MEWIKLAGKYQDDPQYDEVLEYIKQYRDEIDAENGNQLKNEWVYDFPNKLRRI